MHVIIYGNIVAGIEIIGPFDSSAEATEYAERECAPAEWLVCQLSPPLYPDAT